MKCPYCHSACWESPSNFNTINYNVLHNNKLDYYISQTKKLVNIYFQPLNYISVFKENPQNSVLCYSHNDFFYFKGVSTPIHENGYLYNKEECIKLSNIIKLL